MKNRLTQYIGTKGWHDEPESGFGNIVDFPCSESEWGAATEFKPSYSSEAIRDLIKKLSGKSDENTELREQVEAQAEKIDELAESLNKLERAFQEIFNPAILPELGEFEKWRESISPTSEFRGKHVAYLPGNGVIACSDTLDSLMEELGDKSKIKHLTIGFVPTSSVFI